MERCEVLSARETSIFGKFIFVADRILIFVADRIHPTSLHGRQLEILGGTLG